MAFKLRVLGGAFVESQDGPLTGRIAQRHRLALLSLLAAAPAGTLSRDKLMTYLWPERDAEHARNLLNQTTYVLRKTLGEEALISIGDELRLNPDVVTADAHEFEAAIEGEELERAVALYRGPFLDGFHLPDAHEFERWVDRERSRLARRHRDALEALAEAAESRGDLRAAVRWSRRLAAEEPYSSRVALRLMRALAAAGDPAGALRHARVHEALVRDEFGRGPDAEVSALAGRLRAEPGAEVKPGSGERQARAAAAEEAGPAPGTGAALGAAMAEAPAAADTGNDGGTGSERARSRHFWPVSAALAGFALVGVVVLQGGLWSSDPAAADLALKSDRVLVLPLRNETGDSALARLGWMTSDWVSHGLARTELVEVVTSRSVAGQDRGADAGPWQEPAGLRELARSTGAGLVVSGAYYLTGDTARLQVEVFDPIDGTVVAVFGPVAAPISSPMASIERLRQLVVGGLAARVDPRMRQWADRASRPPGYQAYLDFVDGLSILTEERGALQSCVERSTVAYERTHAAVERFTRAAAADSSFTQPLLWAMTAYSHISAFEAAESILSRLEQRRTTLAPLDLAVLDAEAALLHGDYAQGLHAMRRVLAIAPESEYHERAGRFAVWLNRPHEAIRILTATDPTRGWLRSWFPYWKLLTQAHHALGDHEAESRAARQAKVQFPGCSNPLDAEAIALAAMGDLAGVTARLDEILGMGSELFGTRIVRYVLELQAHGHGATADSLLDRALQWYEGRPESRPENPRAVPREVWGRAQAYLVAGRWADASVLFEWLFDKPPLRLISLGEWGFVAAKMGDVDGAEGALARLAEIESAYPLGPFRSPTYWRAAIMAGLGNNDEAVRLLRQALETGYRGIQRLHVDPYFSSLRGYPPFEALIRPRG